MTAEKNPQGILKLPLEQTGKEIVCSGGSFFVIKIITIDMFCLILIIVQKASQGLG